MSEHAESIDFTYKSSNKYPSRAMTPLMLTILASPLQGTRLGLELSKAFESKMPHTCCISSSRKFSTPKC